MMFPDRLPTARIRQARHTDPVPVDDAPTTRRLLRNGRPPCSLTDGSRSSMNAYWASDKVLGT